MARRWGENTDGQGFLASLREVADLSGERVVVLGAGGAARAIAVELALAGAAAITIVSRNQGRAHVLVDLVADASDAEILASLWPGTYVVPDNATVLVYATSVGLSPDVDARLDIDPDTLREDLVVCDVIPNPPETSLLNEASERGATTLDRRGMLVNQAAINIRIWTGVDFDRSETVTRY